MKHTFKSFTIVIILLSIHLYFYNSEHIKKVDYALYDLSMKIFNKFKGEDAFYSVVVDIDEKSLQQLGQWPWPRILDAQLVEKINSMYPSAMGINILFPEEDRISPLHFQKFYKTFFDLDVEFNQMPESLKDNDKLFSQAINRSDITLATYFKNSRYSAPHCEKISYRDNKFSHVKTKYKATSLLCNHESIQSGVENFGFINASTDSDGIFRRIPLYMNYKDKIFPSFALATILSFDNTVNIDTDKNSILIRFSKNKPKVFSAVDVLNDKVLESEFQGKIIIIGSSAIGLSPTYITANGEKISSSMIHAITVDNLLSNNFIIQPEIYKKINLLISFILSLLLMVLLFKKFYVYLGTVIIITAVSSIFWFVNNYISGVYISIGYLSVPLFYFFVFALFYHIKVLSKEREDQEKLLIKQSKFASMGEMIALIAHQWRQPLSTINGIVLNIDIDQKKERLNEEQLDSHLNQIEETTAYLSKTINDFTEFFAKNKNRDTFYVEDMVRQVKSLTAITHYKNIQIIYRTKKSISFIGYKSELIQSLLILLNNSIFVCQRNVSEGMIYIDSELVDNKLIISVEDNGGGVDLKDLKKIFNPYFTTKGTKYGTGLGLYILKLIVEESMSGKVLVSNTKDGVVFTLEIPILEKL